MKSFLNLLFLFFACTFFSCQKPFLIPDGDNSFIYDADAKKFIDSSGITDEIQKMAINNFTIQLKDSNLWAKFMAIYPIVGGTGETIKWNLKDPRNIDAAYRLTIHGTPVYGSSGVLFPTNSDYADTHFSDNLFNL